MTTPDTTADAAIPISVSTRDSAATIHTIWRRMAPVLRSSASSDLRPLADIRKVPAMPIAL
jgi:hypothetical protein